MVYLWYLKEWLNYVDQRTNGLHIFGESTKHLKQVHINNSSTDVPFSFHTPKDKEIGRLWEI